MLKCLAGLIQPTEGQILFGGRDQIAEQLDALLAAEPIAAYVGFDPTASSLHGIFDADYDGGPGLETLFVTSARFTMTDAHLADNPHEGFGVRAGVCGLPANRFGQ